MGFQPSVQCIVEIFSVRLAAALFIPWFGTLHDEFDPFIPFML